MKSAIKIIVIFGIITSFSSVYSMESKSTCSYFIKRDSLKSASSLTDVKGLTIYRKEYSSPYWNNPDPISEDDHRLFTEEGLDLKLIVLRTLEKSSDSEGKNRAFEEVCAAVSMGISLDSKHRA